MCGIAGILNFNKDAAIYADVKKMTDAIRHRGPDGEGIWVGNNVGLGHRRLSIIDMSSRGSQPMANEDGSIRLVFNGEIYNFKKLKSELKKKGHYFKSNSDTETILHAYEEWGTKCFSFLEGMFALALWDTRGKELILARDRLGIKPLYYSANNKRIIFASEIKGILASQSFKKEINFESLDYYFFHNCIPISRAIFKDIHSVLPGEFVVFGEKSKRAKKVKYWHPVFIEDKSINEEEAGSRLFQLLENSVKSHMIADVSMGVALSGGIDSSVLVALLNKYANKSVRTYSFSFQNDTSIKQKEFGIARRIAKLFKTDHHSFILKPQALVQNLDRIVESFDMPISTFAFDYYLCQKASKDLKVIFTGDGTEELFGKYWNHRLAQNMTHILSYLNSKKDYIRLEKEFMKIYSRIISERAWQFSGLYAFRRNDRERLYSGMLLGKTKENDINDYLFDCFRRTTAKNFLNKILEIDTRNFLVSHTLTIIDRVSMANSVEVRLPFLDHHLVEFCASLPARLKSQEGITKYIFRRAAKKIIPEDLIGKFQSGVTGPPVNNWLLFNLEKYVRQVLSPRNLAKHGFFNNRYIASLIREYYQSKDNWRAREDYYFTYPAGNHTIKIWKLIIFQLWWEKYFS